VVSETGVKLLLQMGVQRLAFCWYFSFMNNWLAQNWSDLDRIGSKLSRLFYTILDYSTLRIKRQGLLVGAPPCSLLGPACSSVHRRSVAKPLGDISRWKVRLSNRIWFNFVAGTTYL
jgi:hypothetical protein